MAGRHNAKTTEAPPEFSAPAQWVPDVDDGVASGNGPAAYVEGAAE